MHRRASADAPTVADAVRREQRLPAVEVEGHQAAVVVGGRSHSLFPVHYPQFIYMFWSQTHTHTYRQPDEYISHTQCGRRR